MRLRTVLLGLALLCGGVTCAAQLRVVAGSSSVAATIEAKANRIADQLSKSFPGVKKDGIRIFAHAGIDAVPPALQSLLHPGTAGFALLGRDELHILLNMTGSRPPNDLETVLTHELVHVFLDRMCGAAGRHVSRWFHEGIAQYLSGHLYLQGSEEDIVFRAMSGSLLRFSDLHDSFPEDAHQLSAAYAQSYSLVKFLAARHGVDRLLKAAKGCGPTRSYEQAFALEFNEAIPEDEWREYLLDSSGARLRVLFDNCFSLVLILALPLLALAGIKRWNRDFHVQQQLKDSPPPEPEQDPHDQELELEELSMDEVDDDPEAHEREAR